jgi:hypothetical protein
VKASREQYLAERRKRYRDDPAYREAVVARVKARYESKGFAPRGCNKPRTITTLDGRLVIVIGLGAVSGLLGVSKKAVRRYMAEGIIEPVVIDDLGRKWFSKADAEVVAALVSGQSKRREPIWRLKRRVEQARQEGSKSEGPQV